MSSSARANSTRCLNARPEDRRAIIEEAAGILKFRKRKEKAERRLSATEGNLLRLTDLLREVRRQLRPLERQADAARRHDGIVAELDAVQLHLAGREIEQLRTRERKRAETRAKSSRRPSRTSAFASAALDAEVADAEHALAMPGDDDVADMLARTEALRERSRGLVNLVTERTRSLERELAAVADEGVVESLVAEAAQLREQLHAVDADFGALAPTRAEARRGRSRVSPRSRTGRPSATPRRRTKVHNAMSTISSRADAALEQDVARRARRAREERQGTGSSSRRPRPRPGPPRRTPRACEASSKHEPPSHVS